MFLTDWDSLLGGVEAVVSTLGMIGPNDQMEKINGDATIIAVDAAKKAGEHTHRVKYFHLHSYQHDSDCVQ